MILQLRPKRVRIFWSDDLDEFWASSIMATVSVKVRPRIP